MKYVLTPDAYARLAAGLASGTPLTASDTALAPYADKHYKYDGDHRVSAEVVAGVGSNQGSGDGRGTITYSYTSSGNADGYNAWKTETVETALDASGTPVYSNTVFTNFVGQVMLRVSKDLSTGQTFSKKALATFHSYDDEGRLKLRAQPSAFAPQGVLHDEYFCSTSPDLLVDAGGRHYTYLADAVGEVDTYDYASATSPTITPTVAGDVEGLLAATYAQLGDTGTRVQQSATTYYEKSYTPVDGAAAVLNPVATATVFPNAVAGMPGTGNVTTYSYGWRPDGGSDLTNQVLSAAIALPTVTVNGPGTGTGHNTTVAFFDAYNNPEWTKDAAGFLAYTAFDPVTGAAVKAIADADDTQTGDFADLPSGWSTPSGGGLHLATLYGHDDLGRATSVEHSNLSVDYTVYLDATHEVRSYTNWDAVAHTTTGPVRVVREYRPAANAQQPVYVESLAYSNAVTLGYDGTTGAPTGSESFAAGDVLSLSRTLANAAGQAYETDDYFSLAGLAYAQGPAVLLTSTPTPVPAAASNDSASGNYHKTVYGYDAMGRNSVVKAPTGTVSRTVFDGFGNAASIWVGTDDSGATDLGPAGSGGSNNMVAVAEVEYDESCGCAHSSGDGKPTKITYHPGGSEPDRVTENYYDWRGRLVATKDGVQTSELTADNAHPIAYYALNNLGQVTCSYSYDGDGDTSPATRTNGVPDRPSSSLLRAKTDISYDEQSRPYRVETHSVDPATGTASTATLVTNTYYGPRGEMIETRSPGGLVTKQSYDGAGRLAATYATDGAGGTSYSAASSVTNDHVLEQVEYAYDVDGNVILTTSRQRFHDTAYTGPLGTPASTGTTAKARVSYVTAYYDAADRPTASVDVGTNGGSAYARPGSAPSRSGTVLVTSYAYDAAGRLQDVTDPRGIVARTTYDLLGRTAGTVANYTGGTPTDAADQTTLYTYDGSDHVRTMTALLKDGPDAGSALDVQTTQYVYGEVPVTSLTRSGSTATATAAGHGYRVGETVVLRGAAQSAYNGSFTVTAATATTFSFAVSGSPATPATGAVAARRADAVASNDLLSTVRYPDKTAGTAGTAASDVEAYRHNALGEVRGYTDQNGTVHAYAYDVLGRQTADAVNTLGSGVNGAVRRLEAAYDTQGNASLFTSYSAASGGTVVNQVQRTFNGLGQLTAEYQSHAGAVNTASTPKVQYAYTEMAGGANDSRLRSVTYPSGRVLRYEYGTSGSLGDKISRVNYLADDASGTVGTHLVDYSYLGLSTIIDKNHPETGIDTTYVAQGMESPTDGGDKYTGLDRFGRVVDQRSVEGGTAVDRFQYGYDADSNVLYKDNLVSSAHSELYHADGATNGYDGLNRLTSFARGTLSDANSDGAMDTVATDDRAQAWSLDALGNWASVTTDGSTDTRSHNARNQLTSRGTFDNAGNSTTVVYDNGELHGALCATSTYAYDAWNRQVTASVAETDQLYVPTTGGVTYAYDALGRRLSSVVPGPTVDTRNDACYPSSGYLQTTATTNDRYYSAAWQDLEERTTTVQTTIEFGTATHEDENGNPVTDYCSSTSACCFTAVDQYVWGLAYVDDLVLRDRSATGVSALDPSFNSTGRATADFASGTDAAHAVAVQDDGKVVAAGTTVASGGGSDLAIVRYNANGTLDATFGSGGTGKVTASLSTAEGWGAIDLEAGGNILVAGYETNGSGNKDFLLARYLPNGTLDTAFGTGGFVLTDFAGGDDFARAVLEQPDGSIVVAGDATVGGHHVLTLAKYTAAGILDNSFDTDGRATLAVGTGDAYGYGLALQPDGKLVAVGYASGSATDMLAARFNADGSPDSGTTGDANPADGFGTAGIATVDFDDDMDVARAVAISRDGRIVLAGDGYVGGDLLMTVAQLSPDGSLDTTFGSGGRVAAFS